MIMISGILSFNGTPTQRTGVKTDYQVRPTINGIKHGQDELLEKAVRLIKFKKL
jgi:hypothetical protein